jgi:hypothetical protein
MLNFFAILRVTSNDSFFSGISHSNTVSKTSSGSEMFSKISELAASPGINKLVSSPFDGQFKQQSTQKNFIFLKTF